MPRNDEVCYAKNPTLRALAHSLSEKIILTAHVREEGSNAWVELGLSDGRTVRIGVHGCLYDEAYLIFTHENAT